MKERRKQDRRFARFARLVGWAGLARLATKTVAVFGLGGVGSWAAEALARSGIGHLVLIDFDTVEVTNINRQLGALSSTIGQAKVAVLGARFREINPAATIEELPFYYHPAMGEVLLRPDYDYVVDAIDSVPAKVDLLACCWRRGLRVVSAMGAGNRLDPTRLVVTDISETHTDPLARAVRQGLRREGITEGIKVVFSTEPPLAPGHAEDLQGEEEPWGEEGSGLEEAGEEINPEGTGQGDTDCRRKRGPAVPGSSALVPPAMGFTLASVVVRELLGAS